MYRPPSDTSVLLNFYTNSEIILRGDLNLNCLNIASDYLKDVSNKLSDWLSCNKEKKYIACGVFDFDFSDHCPIAYVSSTMKKNDILGEMTY